MFEQGNTTYLKLTNPSNDTVLFKIKTTAPKKYCVRPNSGVLEPYSKVEIASKYLSFSTKCFLLCRIEFLFVIVLGIMSSCVQ